MRASEPVGGEAAHTQRRECPRSTPPAGVGGRGLGYLVLLVRLDSATVVRVTWLNVLELALGGVVDQDRAGNERSRCHAAALPRCRKANHFRVVVLVVCHAALCPLVRLAYRG